MPVITISREELKDRLVRGESFVLVSVLGEWGHRAKRIPGSVHYATPEEALSALDPHDEIAVYCAGEASPASVFAYRLLRSRGYRKVRRYAGGVADWEAAGYPVEGELVTADVERSRREENPR